MSTRDQGQTKTEKDARGVSASQNTTLRDQELVHARQARPGLHQRRLHDRTTTCCRIVLEAGSEHG